MEDTSLLKVIESLFSDLDLEANNESSPTEYKTLSFHFPADYKEKYDLIQKKTKNQFGKRLKEVIKKSIDSVQVDKGA
jgi:hypothetical protein